MWVKKEGYVFQHNVKCLFLETHLIWKTFMRKNATLFSLSLISDSY